MTKNIKLSVNQIYHNYVNANGELTRALNGISLNIFEGEFIAIIGSSGCGKSTFLNIMAGLINPTQGEVVISNQIEKNKHKDIGYIAQMDTLLPWRTIIDNVALGLEIEGLSKKERYKIARNLIHKSGLQGFEGKYPNELSGGMRKRVMIIRTIAQKPDIIFMDEPFGPLDIFTKRMLQREILSLWREYRNTIIYVTHDIAEAITLADRIVLLSYRPSQVMDIYEVTLPRPRNIEKCKYTPYFIELEKEIWEKLSKEVHVD